MKSHLSIIVCGELDCGKSTLIGRLLFDTHSLSKEVEQEARGTKGFNFAHLLDSLQEERQGQFTLDTTQAFLKYKRRQYALIDVPGHRELLKNMLTGASYADVAILVIDAQKSIEQQTKRHAFILKFLGIEQIIIALNKMDLVGFNEIIFAKTRGEIEEFFKQIQLHLKYFIPISAEEGENLLTRSKKMAWHKGLLLIEALNACFKKKNNSDFRFPVQDIYNLNKEKVAVGQIISGKIKKGEQVRVLPINKECEVKAIKFFKKDKSTAEVPESIGLLLDDMSDLRRGQVICKPKLPKLTSEILTKIFCVYSINLGEKLRFQCTTQEVAAWISGIKGIWDTVNLEAIQEERSLPANSLAELLLTMERPVVVEKFIGINRLGRFVLRSNKDILAIGVVL